MTSQENSATLAGPDQEQPTPTPRRASAGHIRGSSLLMVGRLLAILLNFGVQVLTIRYLSKADFGALSWALSVVAVAASANLLGLAKTVARFVPMHQERGELGAAFGAMLFAAGCIVGLGASIVAVFVGGQLVLGDRLIADPNSARLLLLLIFLTPIQALDNMLQNLAAVFLGARAIFFRRHLLGPLAKLLVVVAVVLTGGTVMQLAAGHLAVGIMGVSVYVTMISRHVKKHGLWDGARKEGLQVRTGELVRFSFPLYSADLVLVLQANVAVLVLKHFHGAAEVAALRAIVPVAGLCLVAIQSFKFLYVPNASRLLARQDHAGISEMYWRTTLWVSVLSFPAFAVACFLAEPVTTTLFGERYAGSAILLAIMSAATYFNACLGLNGYTLQVFGRTRPILINNTLGTVAIVAASLLLVPSLGALGAALAAAGSVVLLNALNQYALARSTPIGPVPRGVALAYARIAAGALVLLGLRLSLPEQPIWLAAAVIAVSLIVLRSNRDELDIDATFPELRRLGPLARLLGGKPKP